MTLTLRHSAYSFIDDEYKLIIKDLNVKVVYQQMKKKDFFTPKEISQITGVSTRTLHYYHEIKLLIPSLVTDNGYRYYSTQDIAKLQTILFLRELNLSLNHIQSYFDKSPSEKNKILDENVSQLVQKRDQLNQMINYLNHHLKNHKNEEINMDKFDDYDIQRQYDKEAEMKYGDTKYYQAFKEQRNMLNNTDNQRNDKDINHQLNQFFDEMNYFLENEQQVNDRQVCQHITKLKGILRTQVPNVDNQFLEYIALTYENDERFAKNINKGRNDNLNQFIADAIQAYLQ